MSFDYNKVKDNSVLKDKEIKHIRIFGTHNPPEGDIAEKSIFDPFECEPDGPLLDHHIFASVPSWAFEVPSCNVTYNFGELDEPEKLTRLDKIRNKITSLFHPITKYRIRIVNTDYDCYED